MRMKLLSSMMYELIVEKTVAVDVLVVEVVISLFVILILLPEDETLQGGEFLSFLGTNCPVFKKLELHRRYIREYLLLTNQQIETFTKGCSQLKSFGTDFLICHSYVFQCFGLYNPLVRNIACTIQ